MPPHTSPEFIELVNEMKELAYDNKCKEFIMKLIIERNKLNKKIRMALLIAEGMYNLELENRNE